MSASSSSSELLWKYAARLSYAGTRFCGWQKQVETGLCPVTRTTSPSGPLPSVQSTVQAALERITREETVSVVGSGRTDSGVHALGQVAHFVLRRAQWDPRILQKALNSLLPQDIRVHSLVETPLDFHAQRSVIRKQYSYYFQQGPCALPHLEPYSWWIRKELDREGMQRALSELVGERDFKPFQSSGARPGPTVRQLFEARIEWEPIGFPGGGTDTLGRFGLVRVRLVGSGFLKQMVRGIAGTLLQIGERRRDPACMREILESLDRRQVGPTAPGRALWLERVWYPEALDALFNRD